MNLPQLFSNTQYLAKKQYTTNKTGYNKGTQGMRNITLFSLLVSLLVLTSSANAEDVVDEQALKLIYNTELYNTVEDSTKFPGESIGLTDLKLSWTVTDMVVTGNGLPINISRTYQDRKAIGRTWKRNAFNHWKLGIPKINRHLGKFLRPQFLGCEGDGSRYSFEIDGVGDFRAINKNPNIQYPANTKVHFNNNWLLICEAFTTRSTSKSTSGSILSKNITDGYTLLSPDGTKYRFAYKSNESMEDSGKTDGPHVHTIYSYYVSDIEDKQGNYLTYNYQYRSATAGSILTVVDIKAKDGRKVSFDYSYNLSSDPSDYNVNQINSITDGSRTVTYHYGKEYFTLYDGEVRYVTPLEKVAYPENLTWEYEYNRAAVTGFGSEEIKSIKTPWGANIAYEYGFFEGHCGGEGLSFSSLTKRTVTNNAQNLEYNYLSSVSPENGKTYLNTSITGPDKKDRYSHVCYDQTERKNSKEKRALHFSLEKQEIYTSDNQSAPLRTIINNWSTLSYTGQSPKLAEDRVVLTKEITDSAFSRTYSSFDYFGNAKTLVETGSGVSRTKSTSYYNNASKWLIGFIDNETISGSLAVTRNHDSLGRMTKVTNNGSSKSYTYYTNGLLQSETDAMGNTTDYSNYYRGVARQIDFPTGSVSYLVDSLGNVTQKTNERGYTTKFTFDNLNRLKTIDYPTGSDLSVSYSGNSSVTISRGSYQEIQYLDDLNRIVKKRQRDTLNNINYYQHFEFDSIGRNIFVSTKSTTPNKYQAKGTASAYDGLNRRTTSKLISRNGTLRDPDQPPTIHYTTSYSYPSALREDVKDPNGYTRTTNYRAYGSPDSRFVLSTNQPSSSGTITTAHNNNNVGKLLSVTQGGKTISYGYHPTYTDFVTSETHPSFTIYYGRNALGNMTSKRVGTSATTYFTYTDKNQLANVNYPTGTADVNYTYELNGLIKSVTNGVGDWHYTYDANDNMRSRNLITGGQAFNFGYAYNGLDMLSRLTYPDSTYVDYAPNAFSQATKAGGFATNVKSHANGSLASFNYGNGLTYSLGLDFTGLRVNKITAKNGSQNLISKTYTYDGLNNVKTITDGVDSASSVSTMLYDGSNRLTSATSSAWSGNGKISYGYDKLGNITNQTLPWGNMAYSYDSKNLLSKITGCNSYTFQYDAYGNVTNNGWFEFDFNDASQMTSAVGGGKNKSYAYDAHGRRVKIVSGGQTEIEIHDDSERLLWVKEANGSTRKKVYLGNKMVAQVRAGKTTYSHFDTLGSTIAISDANKAMTYEQYFPFGDKVKMPEGTNNDQWYNGKRYDNDTFLSYYSARYYDPVIGRFYSNDPVGFSNMHNFNRYTYANNNPYKYVDPDGHRPRKASHDGSEGAGHRALVHIAADIAAFSGVIDFDTAQAIKDALPLKQKVNSATKRRVKLRKKTKEKIDEKTPKNGNGEELDPHGNVLNPDQIDIGHKPGQEWHKRKKMHEKNGSTRAEVIEAENDADLYHKEDRSRNRSHKDEEKD